MIHHYMIEIPNKIDKSELADKPRVVFDGIIEEIDTEDRAQKAIETLREQKVVGFDTETRPSFTKGQGHIVKRMSDRSVIFVNKDHHPLALAFGVFHVVFKGFRVKFFDRASEIQRV